TTEDFKYAEAMNASIKLLGTSRKIDNKFYSMVAPVMIKQDHPLAGVNGVFNGIFVHGNVLDDVMFYGRGAGKLPTASAVVSDVVDAVKHMGTNIMTIWEDTKTSLGAFEDFESNFFVRIKDVNEGLDESLMFAVREAFGDVLYVKTPGIEGEFAFTTKSMREGDFAEKIAGFDNVCSVIRTNF
ncbi:MAG: homoserine dehydrogenase, partial [Lachnospiraceae bacterium]|nr:homoserine dehydrogenase [Lachnospiraceae bacterium]